MEKNQEIPKAFVREIAKEEVEKVLKREEMGIRK